MFTARGGYYAGTPEDIHTAYLKTMLGFLGITDVEFIHAEGLAVSEETKAAGLRGVLGQTVIQFPVADAKTPADGLARAETFINAYKDDPLITPAVAPHAIYTLDAATLRAARELSHVRERT